MYRAVSASVLINGTPYTVVDELPSRSVGFDQDRSVCTVRVREYPDCVPGDPAQVLITINGETTTYMTGVVAAIPLSDEPAYDVHITDTLYRLQQRTTAPMTWRNTAWTTALRGMLHAAGYTDSDIASLDAPGSVYVLGPVYPITIPTDTLIADVINDLLQFAGASLWSNADGRLIIRTDPVYPRIPTVTYAYGATGSERGIYASRRTITSNEERIARITVRGPRRPDRSIPDATVRLDAPGRTVVMDIPYCQTDVCAQAIAQREIIRQNRASVVVEFEAPLDPTIQVYDTIAYRNPVIGFAAATPGIVLGVRNQGDTMTIRAAIGIINPSGSVSLIPPPTASFTYTVERQPIQLAGVLATHSVVTCTPTASDPSGMGIVRMEWKATLPDGTVSPRTVRWSAEDDGDPPTRPVFVFSTLTGATITLAVESASGEGASVTLPIDPPPDTIFTRRVSAATPAGWRVLRADGWRSYGANCTAVPNINDVGPFLAGFQSGAIYRTEDELETPPELLATVDGTINSIYIDEVDGTTITIAHGSRVSVSRDGGQSWSLRHVFDDPVRYAAHEAGNVSYIRACSGRVMWLSSDGGSTWTQRLVGEEGTEAMQVARAVWGTACVFRNGSNLASAILFETDGETVDWSAIPDPDLPVNGLTAIAPLLNEEGWVVGSGGVRDLTRDGLVNVIYAAATGAGKVYKLVRGESSTWRAVAVVDIPNGGTWKVVNWTTAREIDTPDTSYRVGYGATTDPPLPPELIFVPKRGTTLYHYIPGQGWQPKPLPSTPIGPAPIDDRGWWQEIVINPDNPTQWVVYDRDRYYWSGNNGVTWVQLEIPVSATQAKGVNLGFVFRSGGHWVATKHFYSTHTTGEPMGYIARGTGVRVIEYKAMGNIYGQPSPPVFKQPAFVSYQQVLCGANNEVLIRGGYEKLAGRFGVDYWIPVPDYLFLVPNNHVDHENMFNGWYWSFADTRTDTSRGLFVTHDMQVSYTPDYRSVLPSPIAAAGNSVVMTAHGLYAGSRDDGIVRIDYWESNPILTPVIAMGRPVGKMVRGRRRRAVAAIAPAVDGQPWRTQIAFYNGQQWGMIDAPEDDPNGIVAIVEH